MEQLPTLVTFFGGEVCMERLPTFVTQGEYGKMWHLQTMINLLPRPNFDYQ